MYRLQEKILGKERPFPWKRGAEKREEKKKKKKREREEKRRQGQRSKEQDNYGSKIMSR
jgi:hypothetical protein